MTVKTQRKGETISVRLYPEDEELLREMAPPGTKALGTVAAELLIKTLRKNSDEELGYLRQKVVEVQGELQDLRQEFHDSVKTILFAIVDRDQLTKKHVTEWFDHRFKK